MKRSEDMLWGTPSRGPRAQQTPERLTLPFSTDGSKVGEIKDRNHQVCVGPAKWGDLPK